jgi:hypothetical protein
VTGDLETFVAAGAMLFMLREVLHGIAGLGGGGGGGLPVILIGMGCI